MQKRVKDCMQIFTKFLQKIKQFDYFTFLEQAQNIYAVRQFKISLLNIQSATQIYQNIFYKFSRNLLYQVELNWWQNQLRIFVWTLILYVKVKQLAIQSLKQNDWQFFSILFPNKKLILFEYQSINILKEHGQAKKWTPDEDIIFDNLVKQKGLKCKWSQLAKLLYIESQRTYFRTPKQCRQRWLNHLDPSKSKSQWTLEQDYIIIRYVYQRQKKWAEISKLLHNKRNQHSIKNRFKSLTTKQQKFHSQKLQQSSLIPFVYQRYTKYFENCNKNKQVKGEQLQIQKKQQSRQEIVRQKSIIPQQENSNSRIKQNLIQDKIGYNFGWIDQQKKLNKIIMKNNNSQVIQPAQDKSYLSYLSYASHVSNFDENNYKPKHQIQKNNSTFLAPKARTFHQIPPSYQENNINNYKFHSLSVIPHPSNQNSYNYNTSPDQQNQNDFFPSYDLDIKSQSSDIYEQKLLSEKFLKPIFNKTKGYQIDQQQQQVRAQILLSEDPFDLLKPYFYNNHNHINAFLK